MDEIEIQKALNDFENRLLEEAEAPLSRAALRSLLFRLADSPESGSLGDAVEIIASRNQPSPIAASAVLRALAVDGLVQDNTANHLARNIVFIVETGLPGLYDFLGGRTSKQTNEKIDQLRGAINWVEGQLSPLRVSYTTLDSMIAEKKSILSRLSHGRLIEFGKPFHHQEVKDAIVSVYASLEDVSKIAATLAADVETCG